MPSTSLHEKDPAMKTILFASAAVICLGVGAARADQGPEDSGFVNPNSYFTELPGVDATAPGTRPNDATANAWQTGGQQQQPTATTQANPYVGVAPTTTSRGS
jgi:hypothetical protein